MKKNIIILIIIVLIVGALFASRVIYQINPNRCNSCGNCYFTCDYDAVYYDFTINRYQINSELCSGCGDCVSVCNRNAIEEVVSNSDQTQMNSIVIMNNYPNPFNSETKISYEIKSETRSNEPTTISIFNMKGQLVKEEKLLTRSGSFIWDGTNNNGKKVQPGTYFYKLKSGNQQITKKMSLIK